MDDGVAVEVVEIGHDPGLEFGLGCYPDMAEHRAGDFRKEAFDKIEPRAVFGREHEAETSRWLRCEPGPGFLRDVGRVIVKDQFDGCLRRIGVIKLLEKGDGLARAVAVLDAGMKCIADKGCTVCVDVCPLDVLAIDEEAGVAYMKYDECWYCTPSEVDCPTGAVKATDTDQRFQPSAQ